MIKFVKTETGSNKLEWEYNGKTIVYEKENVYSGIIWEDKIFVYIYNSSKPSVSENSVLCLSLNGDYIYTIKPPIGWSIRYLTTHSTAKVAVVCSSENGVVDSWFSDWHFAINPDNGELTRHCPAY